MPAWRITFVNNFLGGNLFAIDLAPIVGIDFSGRNDQ